MVVGRRELSAILLAILALVFYLVLLSTVPSGAQTGGNTTNGGQSTIIDDFIVDEQITDDFIVDEQVTVQEDEDLQEDLIIEPTTRKRSPKEPTIINIPNKPLPPTGGLPVYIMVGSSVLVGAGLLGLGISIRRGPRR